ncbi:MAG: DNA-formamidopyrimidine glycosylase family protein [Chloroflexota bacterium]
MPELPEVEALRLTLDSDLVGHTVSTALVRSPAILKTFSPPFTDVVGRTFQQVGRRGKWLLLALGGGEDLCLAVHLMTGGRLRLTNGQTGPSRSDAAILGLAAVGDLRVSEIGSRKQSAIHLVRGDGTGLVSYLGPDLLADSLDAVALLAALRFENRQLKPALVDQRTLAGLGNAWADEVLHAARLSPLLLTSRLTLDQSEQLRVALAEQIGRGIAAAAKDNYLTQLKPDRRPYLRIHGRGGQPCPTCGETLADIWKGERTTTYCPSCQTDGKLFADRRMSRLLR